MKTINGDITRLKIGTIFQCVNCQDVMGSGLARAIFTKWPKVKEQYHLWNKGKTPLALLGTYKVIQVEPNVWVVNIYGQLEYGPGDKRYADYGAIKTALKKAKEDKQFSDVVQWTRFDDPIYFPYGFASALAGGNWDIISQLIEIYFPEATIVKL